LDLFCLCYTSALQFLFHLFLDRCHVTTWPAPRTLLEVAGAAEQHSWRNLHSAGERLLLKSFCTLSSQNFYPEKQAWYIWLYVGAAAMYGANHYSKNSQVSAGRQQPSKEVSSETRVKQFRDIWSPITDTFQQQHSLFLLRGVEFLVLNSC